MLSNVGVGQKLYVIQYVGWQLGRILVYASIDKQCLFSFLLVVSSSAGSVTFLSVV